MDMVNLAVAVVFISNAIILILLVYMLVRILGTTERTQRVMLSASRELHEAARMVRDAGYKVGDQLQAVGAPRNAPATPTPVAGVELLDRLNTMMEDIAGQGSQETERALGDIKQLMERLATDAPGKRGQWQREVRAELENAMAQRNRLAQEVEHMRKRLLEAHRIITELRQANKNAEAKGETVESMRTEINRQQQMIERARERIKQAEERAEKLAADQAALNNDGGAGAQAALAELRRQLAEAAREREQHEREIERLNDAMQRTLVEKDFIEERFLRLDGEREPTAA